MSLAVVILAAEQGTRMNSKTQKILHAVGGKPMVQHVFEAADSVAGLPPVLVVGPGEAGVSALFGDSATYAVQPEQLVKMSRSSSSASDRFRAATASHETLSLDLK